MAGGGATGSGATASQSSGGGGGMHVASSVNDFISKTKSQKRKGLKPSGPELIAYARYLGIDPVADHDLLWIATEALEAPLPSTWSEHFDSNDRVFYYNAQTRVSSWTHPLEHVYRETYTTIVNFRNSNLSPAEVKGCRGCRQNVIRWSETSSARSACGPNTMTSRVTDSTSMHRRSKARGRIPDLPSATSSI